MKETQIRYVKNFLKENGYVDRNTCLRQHITRLGAIIHTLKQEGYDFATEWREENGGRNFYYHLSKDPTPPKPQFTERNGIMYQL